MQSINLGETASLIWMLLQIGLVSAWRNIIKGKKDSFLKWENVKNLRFINSSGY